MNLKNLNWLSDIWLVLNTSFKNLAPFLESETILSMRKAILSAHFIVSKFLNLEAIRF